MTATLHHVARPQPHPSSVAIASFVLEYGYGPEKAAWLVEGFEQAGALFWEIVTSMASLEGFTSPEAYLTATGCAAVLAASVTP